MHNQCKNSCIFPTYAIKAHHGDDGKVPRTGSIGGRYKHGDTACHEHGKSCHPTQVGGKVETVECQVEVEEIAEPDGYRIEDEQWQVLHLAQREHSLPDIVHDALDASEESQLAHQEIEEKEEGQHRYADYI